MTDKPAVRARLRALRDQAAGDPIPAWPQFTARLAPGLVVASYIPVGGEADPAPLVAAALAADCRLALPHVTGREHPIRFLCWAGDAALVAGPFGLRQPAADLPELAPDIVLTPLVGFDRRGHRLGQGAGHYDRAFAAHPDAWRIGVAWSVQEVEALIPDPWDMPLHAIATEKEWITP
ncbi:5-formyltetrahydrofolate cyclo-ligase [Sphingomonas sp.]|uniref:5-formyltetrahydrofolate cyclo-ligase n=1 Tax=Sphingomonas sp. TaxID=28214 RepID=UPI002D7F756E|nr:5-formyltetrahydrofolate cyclo-ligase [Sphingomonas sp.]HEU0044947.1 5-formyltetrahydrofolate cyclo-ligase [Sphingomonas sp.]